MTRGAVQGIGLMDRAQKNQMAGLYLNYHVAI